jgi:ABC-type multidrug transport system fused ATPase/permease subunit
MVIIIIVAYFVKNIFLLFLAWADSKFVFGVSARLSKDLFEGYIKLPYFFYLKRNTSKLIYNATSSVDLYKYALTHLVLLVSEVFVLIGMSTFLFFVEPVGFLCAALLIGSVSVLYYLLNKKRNTEWGEKAQIHQKLKIKNLMQGFGAIKDIIILGIQNFFVKSYQVHNLRSSEMLRKHHLVSQFPKYIFEIMGVIGIMSLLLVLNYKMDNVEKIIIILGVFAAAAFRLMPSANRIINSLQAFRFGIATVDNLSNELKMLNEEIVLKSKELNGESYQNNLQKFKKFNLENISYKYPNTEKKILKNISLKLNKGEIVGLFGKTGSGKSTLVDIITGLLNLDNGNITIDEKKFQKIPAFWQ